MKHYERILFVFAYCFLCLVLVACSGRIYRHTATNKEIQMESVSTTLHTSGSTSQTEVERNFQSNGDRFRLAWTFDTSKPTDSLTNLPPISGITIEGTKERKEAITRINHLISTNDSTAIIETNSSREELSADTTHITDGGLLSETDKALKWGILLTVTGLLIIIGIITYVRKKNPSK